MRAARAMALLNAKALVLNGKNLKLGENVCLAVNHRLETVVIAKDSFL